MAFGPQGWVLVNGQLGAAITARPGERERWRVVNACSSRFLSLRLDGQEVRLLGRDIRPIAEAGVVDRGGAMMMQPGGGGGVVSLATVDVGGGAVSGLADLPTHPAPRDLRQERLDGSRELVFSMGRGMGMGRGPGGGSFTIDGRSFDHERVDQDVAFGSVEEWTIVNDSPMDHPFHLHVWPMQLVQENGRPVAATTWLDVVNVPALGRVTVRIAF